MKPMMWRLEGCLHRDRAGWLRRGPAAVAALAAAGLLLSACATTGMTTAGPEGEPPQAGTAQAPQAAQAEGQQPAGEPPAGASTAGERPAAERPPGARPGAGLLSPLATAGYIPLKLLPCSLGMAGSLVGFLFTFDARVVRETLTLNCGGDWIVTPGMLEGTQEFRSVGRIRDLQGPEVPPPPAPPPTAYAPPILEPGSTQLDFP